MSLSHKYQDFGSFRKTSPAPSEVNVEAFEDEKLQSFEDGYQAGWDDAVKAQSDDKARVSAQLDQSLQEMSFTYHEALTKLTSTMKPMMEQIIEKLLPEMARETLGAHIVEQVTDLLRNNSGHPIEIVVSPNEEAVIEALLSTELSAPFALATEPALGPGQAFVRIGQREREIDIASVVTGISEAVSAFFHHSHQEQNHG